MSVKTDTKTRLPSRSFVGSPMPTSTIPLSVDPEIIRAQKEQSFLILENQAQMAKDRAKAEYESQKSSIMMKTEHDLSFAVSSIEQSKVQSLFSLDQQFQQRKMEIEQRAQEQRIQIESTASQLLMTAEQQKLEAQMQEKLSKLGVSPFGTKLPAMDPQSVGLPRTFQFPNFFENSKK